MVRPCCRLWVFFMQIHMEMLLWRDLLRNLNTDELATQCRKFDIQNLWPDLRTTPILKYLVCCTQSALIHIRRKPVHPRAKNLAECEGLQLMCATSSPAELPKSGIARELQHLLSKASWLRGWLRSIWIYVCLCVFTGRLFWIRQNWDGIKDALKPYGCGRFGHSFIMLLLIIYVLLYAEEMCSSFTSRNLLTFMVWWVCLQLLQEGVEEAYFGNCVLLDS